MYFSYLAGITEAVFPEAISHLSVMLSSITSYFFGSAESEEQQLVTKELGTCNKDAAEDQSTATEFEISNGDNEWILVERSGISQMETSSMENLLIEHPSMSVYQHRGRHSSTGLDSEQSESSGDEEKPDQIEPQEVSTGQANLPHRPRVLSAHMGLTQVKTIKAMQRAQQRHVYKDLSKKNLDRGNLTRYTQGKVSRKQVVHQPHARMAFYTKRH